MQSKSVDFLRVFNGVRVCHRQTQLHAEAKCRCRQLVGYHPTTTTTTNDTMTVSHVQFVSRPHYTKDGLPFSSVEEAKRKKRNKKRKKNEREPSWYYVFEGIRYKQRINTLSTHHRFIRSVRIYGNEWLVYFPFSTYL